MDRRFPRDTVENDVRLALESKLPCAPRRTARSRLDSRMSATTTRSAPACRTAMVVKSPMGLQVLRQGNHPVHGDGEQVRHASGGLAPEDFQPGADVVAWRFCVVSNASPVAGCGPSSPRLWSVIRRLHGPGFKTLSSMRRIPVRPGQQGRCSRGKLGSAEFTALRRR